MAGIINTLPGNATMKHRPGFHLLMGFIILALATLQVAVSRQPRPEPEPFQRTVVLTIPPVFIAPGRS